MEEPWMPHGELAELGFRTEFIARETEISYEYNEFGVFTDKDLRVYMGVTSGCSCSSPWDDYLSDTGIYGDSQDRELLEPANDLNQLRSKLSDWSRGNNVLSQGQLVEALAKLSDLKLFRRPQIRGEGECHSA